MVEDLRSVLEEVKEKLIPTREEEKKILDIGKEIIEKIGKHRECILGGSVGKGTWIRGDVDFDIFVFFDENEEKNCSNILEEILKKEFGKNIIRIHGSRDYFKFSYKGYDVEVVPVLKISKPEEAKTTTDVSPFHVKYVKEKIEENEKIRETIILLKGFCKARNCYGAESYISGFSGYAVELLGIYYKDFERIVEISDNLKPKVIIDIEGYYKSYREIVYNLGQDRLRSPIILIDPVLPKRNAAAALSYNKFAEFVYWLRILKRKPDTKIFEKYYNIEFVKNRAKARQNTLIIREYPKHPNKDVFLTKILAELRRAINSIKNTGVVIYDYGLVEEKDRVYVYFEIWEGKCIRHMGPPAWVSNEHFDRFHERLKEKKVLFGPYIYNTNICVDLALPEYSYLENVVFSRVEKAIEKYLRELNEIFKKSH